LNTSHPKFKQSITSPGIHPIKTRNIWDFISIAVITQIIPFHRHSRVRTECGLVLFFAQFGVSNGLCGADFEELLTFLNFGGGFEFRDYNYFKFTVSEIYGFSRNNYSI